MEGPDMKPYFWVSVSIVLLSLGHTIIVTELEELAAQMREELGDASIGTLGSKNRPPGIMEIK